MSLLADRLSQNGLEPGNRGTERLARADHVYVGVRECYLRRLQIENRRHAHRVALLLYPQVLTGERNRAVRNRDAPLGRRDVGGRGLHGDTRGNLRVRCPRLREPFRRGGALDRSLAREVVEYGKRRLQPQVPAALLGWPLEREPV